MDLNTAEERIYDWATERGIIANGKPIGQAIKTLEEVTELIAAINEGDIAGVKDAIGDVFVTLVNVAGTSGLTMGECVGAAWEEIKDRKGYLTPQGVFVKEKR